MENEVVYKIMRRYIIDSIKNHPNPAVRLLITGYNLDKYINHDKYDDIEDKVGDGLLCMK